MSSLRAGHGAGGGYRERPSVWLRAIVARLFAVRADLSVTVGDAAAVTEALFQDHRVRADHPPPNIICLASAPLYNTFEDRWRAACALDAILS
jgi:hypothetical protein